MTFLLLIYLSEVVAVRQKVVVDLTVQNQEVGPKVAVAHHDQSKILNSI